MKRKWILVSMSLVALLLTVGVGLSQAQGPEPPGPEGEVGVLASTYISPVMSYQGRLLENGSPVTGTKSMTFKLYDAQSVGTLIWTEGPKDVIVTNGLFNVTLGDTTALDVNDLDQELWLEIEVAGTTLPRQKLMGAPYAFSLVPGADVSGNTITGWSVLNVTNAGAGWGVFASSAGTGLNGAALYARSTSAGGIALSAKNDSASSTDAALVVGNDGSGALIKGFGGDGGEDEFRVNNNGTIESNADSYIFVPGTEATLNPTATGVELEYWGMGQVVVNPSTTGTKYIQFGVVLPSVLYGQPVKVEEVTIFYKTSNSSSYITNTYVYRQKTTGLPDCYTLVSDITNRDSTTYTSYSVTPTADNTLSADEGFISVRLDLYLFDAGHSITIGGVRIRLGHGLD
jgi:hypothetical protein